MEASAVMTVESAAKEIVIKYGKEMALELIALCLIPALEEAAAKSENKIDDTVVALLKEPLKATLIDLIKKL